MSKIEEARETLDFPEVDYEATMAAKLKIARVIFDTVGHETLQVLDGPAWACQRYFAPP